MFEVPETAAVDRASRQIESFQLPAADEMLKPIVLNAREPQFEGPQMWQFCDVQQAPIVDRIAMAEINPYQSWKICKKFQTLACDAGALFETQLFQILSRSEQREVTVSYARVSEIHGNDRLTDDDIIRMRFAIEADDLSYCRFLVSRHRRQTTYSGGEKYHEEG